MPAAERVVRRVPRALTAGAVAGLVALLAALLAVPANAADPPPAAAPTGGLTQVTDFGSNPGALGMYLYRPPGLAAGAPLVVALQGCSQSAADYHGHSGWSELADRYGFAVVYPQQSSLNQALSCFSWYQPGDSLRDTGEALSVRQMVGWTLAHLGVDRRRVFVTGLSAGGAMTADLLADYPDVFAGGAVASGIAAQCATDVAQAVLCQETDRGLTPAQWAARARAAAPGWTGPYPRVAIWQGTADTTVQPVNARELRDQWTALHGVGQTPLSTRSLPGGTTQQTYGTASGRPVVATYLVDGMPHGLAVDPGSGPTECGAAGQFYLDRICSSWWTLRFWGLT